MHKSKRKVVQRDGLIKILMGGDFIKLSEKIELILLVIEECKSDSKWYEEQIILNENRENDIRHELEGCVDGKPPCYKRRAVLATQQQKVLINRRMAKDCVTVNQPLLDFIHSDSGKATINTLKQKLGEVRKIEGNLQTRVYHRRVVDVQSIQTTQSSKQNQNTSSKQPIPSSNHDDLDTMIRKWKRSNKKR